MNGGRIFFHKRVVLERRFLGKLLKKKKRRFFLFMRVQDTVQRDFGKNSSPWVFLLEKRQYEES
jgi:hypothetical protein